MKTENIRTFIVKFMAPTNTKPARVLINDLRHRKTRIISYHDSSSDRVEEIAKEYLETKRGIKIKNQSEGAGYMMLHTDDFRTPLKID